MKRIMIGISFCFLALQAYAWPFSESMPKAKITIRVIDEAGDPITNANVAVGFYQGGNAWIGESKSETVRGVSDSNGLFIAQGRCINDVSMFADKEGYYRTSAEYYFYNTKVENGRWQPWNPTNSVVLKEIKTPIPMCVKSVRTDIPVENNSIGFDLEKGDWVSPYGTGVRGDILFKLYRDLNTWKDYRSSLTISFPSEKDGIQSVYASHKDGSKLVMPYLAPQVGYATNLFFEESYQNYQEEREDQNYVFRARTVLDENGEIVSALYGKIHGNILFDVRGSETASLLFKYYLNPTPNDRNIEFDPDQNLFGGRDRFAP